MQGVLASSEQAIRGKQKWSKKQIFRSTITRIRKHSPYIPQAHKNTPATTKTLKPATSECAKAQSLLPMDLQCLYSKNGKNK